MNRAMIGMLLVTILYGCGSNDRGELVGDRSRVKWFTEQPFGMVSIPSGSFTMGRQDEDLSGKVGGK